MSKRTVCIIAFLVIVIAMLPSCSSGTTTTEPEKEKPSTEVPASEKTTEYSSFAEVLKANEEAIKAYNWQTDLNGEELINNVLIKDLNGDDNPELLFIKGGEGWGELHIYTMKNGKAEECVYDVVPKVSYIEDNNAAFAYIIAGGGANYMFYSGKENGTFYIAHNIWDTRMSSTSIKYSISEEGVVKAETVAKNVFNIEPPPGVTDEYKIDGKSVEPDEGAAAFTSHREDYNELLMYDLHFGSAPEDFKVFENLKTDKPLAGSYDEAVKQLEESSAQ